MIGDLIGFFDFMRKKNLKILGSKFTPKNIVCSLSRWGVKYVV